jgi:hypothetical protein
MHITSGLKGNKEAVKRVNRRPRRRKKRGTYETDKVPSVEFINHNRPKEVRIETCHNVKNETLKLFKSGPRVDTDE